MAKYKHLTLSERIEIYTLLKEGKSLRKIGKALNRDPTTIAKEIKKHLEVKETGCGGRPFNQCKHSDGCNFSTRLQPIYNQFTTNFFALYLSEFCLSLWLL